jgi:hypothetical protein
VSHGRLEPVSSVEALRLSHIVTAEACEVSFKQGQIVRTRDRRLWTFPLQQGIYSSSTIITVRPSGETETQCFRPIVASALPHSSRLRIGCLPTSVSGAAAFLSVSTYSSLPSTCLSADLDQFSHVLFLRYSLRLLYSVEDGSRIFASSDCGRRVMQVRLVADEYFRIFNDSYVVAFCSETCSYSAVVCKFLTSVYLL